MHEPISTIGAFGSFGVVWARILIVNKGARGTPVAVKVMTLGA